jgi:uncharacterized membrane protein
MQRIFFLFLILFLLPVPASAQDPVALTFGQTGVFPWRVTGIMPGDHGSTFIELHNNGTEKGIVYIWVDNISMSDHQGNPGGGLANYVYFDISGSQLNSTLVLPARINSFPAAPLQPAHFIIIDSFKAGDTIRLNWTWEFKETGQPQNDAQNNTLGFNLSYTLVNQTTPVVPTIVPTSAPTGVIPGEPGGNPQGPSLYEGGILPGLNPPQRPQLRAPAEDVPEEDSPQQGTPDHRNVMFIAIILLTLAFGVRWLQKKHPEWKKCADGLLGMGIVLTVIGIIYQVFLIAHRNGQHLTTPHSVAGLIAVIFIIPVLVFWKRHYDFNTKEGKAGILVFILWAVIILICLIPGPGSGVIL